MKHIWKKTAAFAAAALMTAALAVPAMTAFAVDPWVEDSAQNGMMDFGESKTPYFNKSLTIYNDLELNAYVPAVTYTYKVENAAPATDTTVTDKNGNSAPVKAGVDGGLMLIGADASGTPAATVDFRFSNKNEAVALTKAAGSSEASNTLTEKIYVQYDATKFPTAGIYRYKLTETADYADYGITREADDVTRYVDVYVEENEDGTLAVYGAVVLYEVTDPKTSVTISTKKTDGFTGSGNDTGKVEDDEFTPTDTIANDPTAYVEDALYTYNYTVEKVIKNSLIGGESFPFTVTASNGTSAEQYFNYSANAVASANVAIEAATTKGTVNTADAAVELKDKEYLALTAVPANVSLTVSEKNTQDATYKVSATGIGDATLSRTTIGWNDESAFTSPLTNYASNKTTKPTATLTESVVTNKMENISITGVLFMVAPFVLMIAAGVFFITVIARSRKREAEENII